MPKTLIRWLVRADLPEVIAMIKNSTDPSWTEQELRNRVASRNTIAIVAERNDIILGAVIYELHPQRLHISNIVVAERYRNQGVGRSLVNKLICKLTEERRNRITLLVSEANLTAQQFFRAMGFKAVQIIRKPYAKKDEDGYCMRYCMSSNVGVNERVEQ